MGSFKCAHPILALDTEDDGQDERAGKGTLLSVQVVGERGERRYFRRRADLDPINGERELRVEFFAWLRSLPSADVWAKNATYDAGNLGLISRGVTATKSSGGYTSWTHPDLGEHVLFDAHALHPGSVAAMGAAVGLEKLEFAPGDERYAMRDAEIVLKWLLFFRRGLEALHEKASLCATVGATASGLWRAMGGRLEKLPQELHHAARSAYRGGRVEVVAFEAQGPAEVWDMRSAFPWAMAQGRFPAGAWEATTEIEPEGIYDVTVRCTGRLGPLAVRCAGTNVYPVGCFRGVWWGSELALAGVHVEQLHAGWRARHFEEPFREYVACLWAARNTPEDSPIHQTAKLLLNALYGVIGHSGLVAGLATVGDDCQLEGRYVAPGVLAWQIDKGHSLGTNPAWSGIITARVRGRLYSAALEQLGRLVYMDTDALFLRGHLGEELAPRPQGDGLGDWRLHAQLDDVEIKAPKVYAARYLTGWRYRAKGISSRAKDGGPSPAEEFVKYARTKWRAPLSVVEAAIHRAAGDDEAQAGAWRDVERALKASYQGRRVLAGGRTEPWPYSMLQGAPRPPWAADVFPDRGPFATDVDPPAEFATRRTAGG